MLSGVKGWGLPSVLDINLFFFRGHDQAKINKDWTSRTLAELNIILLTRNLRFDSDLRKLRHPLLVPLHYLRAKSKIESKVNLNVA